MTPSQFDTIAMLARMKPTSKAREAARLYMLESMKQSEICERLGVSRATVSQAVQRFILTWKLSRLI